MAYTVTEWKSGDVVTADLLNKAEAGISDVDSRTKALEDKPDVSTPTWADISGKPAVVAAGADAAAARAEIGAGTSNLKVGTAATDAKAGNYVPAWADITGKPTIPSVSGLAKQADLDALVARVAALETPAEG